MKAPPQSLVQLDQALATALASLRRQPEHRTDEIERLIAEPLIAARIIGAALLSTGMLYGRQFDHSSQEVQDHIIYYEDSVAAPIGRALELLQYEEVERYIEQNLSDKTVQRLLGNRVAEEKLSAGLLRRLVLSHPQNVCLEIGGRRLTFLVRDGNLERGVTLIFDEKGSISSIVPKLLAQAGEGPRYVLFRGPRSAPKPAKAFVLDLEKGLYCEPEDALQPRYEAGSRVVDLSDSGIIFARASGERVDIPFSTFKYLRPLPFY